MSCRNLRILLTPPSVAFILGCEQSRGFDSSSKGGKSMKPLTVIKHSCAAGVMGLAVTLTGAVTAAASPVSDTPLSESELRSLGI